MISWPIFKFSPPAPRKIYPTMTTYQLIRLTPHHVIPAPRVTKKALMRYMRFYPYLSASIPPMKGHITFM